MSDQNDQPYPELDATPINPREKPMGFWEHLEELRMTLIKSAVVYVLFATIIGIYVKEFNDVLLWPFNYVKAGNPNITIDLGTTTIMESFNVVIQLCLLGALPFATPFIFFFVGQFIAPALTEKEMKMVLPFCVAAFVLFALGSVFSFFLLVPSALRVSIEINQMMGFVIRWTPGSYYSLLTWLVIGMGASFEFPLVIIILVYLRILKVAFLRKYRRHAIVVIFIIAAVVTPTPDPLTQTIFATPLYILYELSILFGARIEKKRLAQEHPIP